MHSVLILGLGKSGVAAARHALENGDTVTVYAGPSSDSSVQTANELIASGALLEFDTEDVSGTYDLCVVSPGIPQTSAFYQNALKAAKEVISEPEYAWRIEPRAWIAVTGTNGKTTTTSLIAHLLNTAGKSAASCGNIGNTCTEAVEELSAETTLVAEMSSYQLASTCDFAPKIAVLLNVTPDHLSWHGGFEPYAQAKFKIFDNLGSSSVAVITSEVLDVYPQLEQDISSRGGLCVRVGDERDFSCAYETPSKMLMFKDAAGNEIELCATDDLIIKGSHNVQNALCAAAVALSYGCDRADVVYGLKSFKALEHRIEPCGSIAGVSYFNDSKATNVDATLKALTAFEGQRLVLLLGGRDKGTDLSELVEACEKACKAVIVYGEAADRFADAFSCSTLQHFKASGMREAFECAMNIAKPDDVVLLSPACASFDEFNSFEHRGEVFKELVKLGQGE